MYIFINVQNLLNKPRYSSREFEFSKWNFISDYCKKESFICWWRFWWSVEYYSKWCFYVPELRTNLWSVEKITNHGLEHQFQTNVVLWLKTWMDKSNWWLIDWWVILGTRNELQLGWEEAMKTYLTVKRWHRHLRHLHTQYLI